MLYLSFFNVGASANPSFSYLKVLAFSFEEAFFSRLTLAPGMENNYLFIGKNRIGTLSWGLFLFDYFLY